MIATLHIPFGYGDCVGGFKYGKKLDQVEYANMLIKDYNEHTSGVDDMMSAQFGRNIALNPFQKETRTYKHVDMEDFAIDCYVTDKDFEDLKVERLLDFYRKDESFIIVVRFRNVTELKQNPDVETDLKMWMMESVKIDGCADMNTTEKFKSLSKKDLKLTFKESSMSAVLLDCKMVSVYSNTKFALWVRNVRFGKN